MLAKVHQLHFFICDLLSFNGCWKLHASGCAGKRELGYLFLVLMVLAMLESDEEGEEKTDNPLRGLQKKRTETEGGSEGADGPGSPWQL